ncbi:MAG: hypothetical protein ACXVO9_12735, partial [Bacteroidia bacterium]
MKKNITTAIVALSALLFTTANAQNDTVRVKETTKETTIVHDSVPKQTTQPPVIVQTPPPPVEEEPKKEIPDLRRGEFGIRYMPTFSSLS